MIREWREEVLLGTIALSTTCCSLVAGRFVSRVCGRAAIEVMEVWPLREGPIIVQRTVTKELGSAHGAVVEYPSKLSGLYEDLSFDSDTWARAISHGLDKISGKTSQLEVAVGDGLEEGRRNTTGGTGGEVVGITLEQARGE